MATHLLYTLCTSISSNLCICILLPYLYIPEYMCICFSLSSNNIYDEGVRALTDGMKYCISLLTLQLVTVQYCSVPHIYCTCLILVYLAICVHVCIYLIV